MQTNGRKTVIATVAIALALTTACSKQREAVPAPAPQQPASPMDQIKMQQAPASDYRAWNVSDKSLSMTSMNGVKYISARDLIETLQFQSDWDAAAQKLSIGDNDSVYELTMNSTAARKEEDKIVLSSPPLLKGDVAYLPVQAVADLFKEDMSYDIEDGRMVVHPTAEPISENMDDDGPVSSELDFADDPNDPFKGEEAGGTDELAAVNAAVWPGQPEQTGASIPVIKNVDMNALIRKARQYLGVKYLFGTGPYASSGRFDCSTFTQYVFGKQGVNLSRTARAQARQGAWVNRKNLRKGDLLFFYVPGRFKSNKTVGHVGIYMGNGNMIHASPKPKNGVQITPINKAYWKKTFLRAKRVAY